MKKLKNSGFSMIELLVVLLIIGILAAVAAPMFLSNSDKAKAAEAVAGLGSIRSAERTYFSQNNQYFAITDGKTYFGTATGNNSSVLGVQIHGVKYFSPDAYTVSTTATTFTNGTPAQDFVITASGANSVALNAGATDDGARNASDVNSGSKVITVQMDNTGATFYKVGSGSWTAY